MAISRVAQAGHHLRTQKDIGASAEYIEKARKELKDARHIEQVKGIMFRNTILPDHVAKDLSLQVVTLEEVKALARASGKSMMEAKRALIEAHKDFDKALRDLNET